MLVKEFFDNTLGKWESHRTYMYPNNNKIKTVVTFFEWTNPENKVYKVNWESVEGKGSMTILLSNDDFFKRDIGYFTNKNTESIILNVDSMNLSTKTSYNDMIFEETIEFLGLQHRTRRTIGYKQNTDLTKGRVILSGSYQEFKIN
jgi:hypothetical protein